jgi:hypothetical protein
MAMVVVESSPPLRRMTALRSEFIGVSSSFFLYLFFSNAPGILPPEDFVELELEADRKMIFEDPPSQPFRIQALRDGGQERWIPRFRRQVPGKKDVPGKFIIPSLAQDKLDFVPFRQIVEDAEIVPVAFSA